MTDKSTLSMHRVSADYEVFYFSNFVTAEEEEYLIRKIIDSPQQKWKTLANRRLQIWGGEVTSKGTLIAEPLPPFVDGFPSLVSRIAETGAFDRSPHRAPNHIIMNEYLPGQGIMPHEDGPRYHPVVATISLGSHTVFHYYRYKSEEQDDEKSNGRGKIIDMSPVLSVLLEPRSLVVSSGSMYTSYLHGINEASEDLIQQHAENETPSVGIKVTNLHLVENEGTLHCIRRGEALKRSSRVIVDSEPLTAKPGRQHGSNRARHLNGNGERWVGV